MHALTGTSHTYTGIHTNMCICTCIYYECTQYFCFLYNGCSFIYSTFTHVTFTWLWQMSELLAASLFWEPVTQAFLQANQHLLRPQSWTLTTAAHSPEPQSCKDRGAREQSLLIHAAGSQQPRGASVQSGVWIFCAAGSCSPGQIMGRY